MKSQQQRWTVALGLALVMAGANAERAEEPAGHPTAGQPWKSSLGIEFLPIPGLNLLFGKHEVTNAEYRKYDPKHKSGFTVSNMVIPEEMIAEGADGDRQPVSCVSWMDGMKFCAWLTEKERKEGLLAEEQEYRLPWDWEWCVALGSLDPKDYTFRDFPGMWDPEKGPPPAGLGNLAGMECVGVMGGRGAVPLSVIDGYNDGFKGPAPVGSFSPNHFGLYDMIGNVTEWTQDLTSRKKPKGLDKYMREHGCTKAEARLLRTDPLARHDTSYKGLCYLSNLDGYDKHFTATGECMSDRAQGTFGIRLVLVLTPEGAVISEDPLPNRPPKRAPLGQ